MFMCTKDSIYLPHCVLNTLVIHPHLILLRIWDVGFIILFIVRHRNCITERKSSMARNDFLPLIS